jgi:spermidine synthase
VTATASAQPAAPPASTPASTPPAEPTGPLGRAAARRRRAARLAILVAVGVCAACGLVYELALVATGSYLVGSSVTQTSVVIAVTMASMGVGAVLAKRLVDRPAAGFVAVELVLGVVGAFAVPALYTAFAWLGLYTPALALAAIAIGALIGAEIPLLMALIGRLSDDDPALVVADLSAADYAGALIGGLAFPFVLLPAAGLLQGSLLVGAVNVAAGTLAGVLLLPRHRLRVLLAAAVAFGAIAVMWLQTGDFQLSAQQRLFRDPIVHSEQSAYQSLVVTESRTAEGPDTRLFLDGDLQFSTLDEHRYHEALVHPAMDGPRRRVLILGGGDGLAAREVLRYGDVEEVRLVDLDPAVTDLARSLPRLVAANGGALDDPRLRVIHQDAFTRVRAGEDGRFDVVVVDLPDPDTVDLAKLYTTEFYGMAGRLLADGGRMVVQAGSPYFVPRAFWTVHASLAAAGLDAIPYHVDVPSFGDWGFVLAGEDLDALRVPADAPPRRFLTVDVLAAATVFPPDRLPGPGEVTASTLLDPTILDAARGGWAGY